MATPAQPVPVLVNRSRSGKLNSDTDILELKDGNYQDRVNVEFNADAELFSDTPALGNALKCNIGSQALQQQQVRIYLDTFFTSATISFYNKNGQFIQSFVATPTGQTLQEMKDSIVQALSTMGWYGVVYDNETSPELYIDVTINAAYSDYFLTIVDVDDNVIQLNVIKEAISVTGEGDYIEIGSKDLLGVTWLFSTTQEKERKKLVNVFKMYQIPAYGGQVCLHQPSHGLTSFESIIIANATGLGVVANGEWTVNVIDPNNFGLFLSQPGAMPTSQAAYGGTIYVNPYGLGQIGVQQYEGETDTYTYTKLIASKKFNFVTTHQIDVDAVLNNNGYLLKFTDDYNYPRTFSYKKEFKEDWALTPLNPNGFYTYETLADEIKNIINYSTVVVEYEEQIQTGGSVPPANWRYAVQFLTDTNATTEVSLLSSPIPTYPPTYIGYSSSFHPTYGAAIGITSTPKINRVKVTGITPDVFKYIQLIGYNYASSSANSTVVNSFIIRKELLSPGQNEIILEHNGNEPDITFFDTTLSQAVRPDIIRVGSNRFCENRLVYGNITTSAAIDIRDWAKTFKYSIKRKEIDSSYKQDIFGEFYDPSNTANFVGYQPWEWYRLYISAETYTGHVTDSVFCIDARLLTQADYDPQEFMSTNGSDRRDMTNDDYINYSLGRWISDRKLFQLYFDLNNIDWDYRIDGVSVSDLFRSVKVSRAERVKEVIASGSYIASVRQDEDKVDRAVFNFASVSGVVTCEFAHGFEIGDFASINFEMTGGVYLGVKQVYAVTTLTFTISPSPINLGVFIEGIVSIPDTIEFRDWTFGAWGNTTLPYLTYQSATNYEITNPYLGSFYSPDIMFGREVYDHVIGDELINFGCCYSYNEVNFSLTAFQPDSEAWWVQFAPNLLGSDNASVFPIIASALCASANSVQINGKTQPTSAIALRNYVKYKIKSFTDSTRTQFMPTSPVLSLEIPIANSNAGTTDNGIYTSLIFRRKKDKYGDVDAFGNTVVFTGATAYKGETSVEVFGGDVFCQQTQFRNFIRAAEINDANAAAYNIISTNLVNTNLRAYDPAFPTQQFPIYPPIAADWMWSLAGDVYNQNTGYSIFNNVQASVVYDPQGNDLTNFITRKYYSQLNPNNAITDKYREFLPLDFQDNPNNFGRITHLEVVNGELFTLQQRGFTREFFNSTGRLQTAEDGDVLIGTGSVLSRKGLRLTMLGTNQKWSACKGFTTSGKEVLMWVNDEFACVVRFGADGTVNLSEREMMSTFFRDRMRFVIGKDSPAHNEGIHTVWDNIGKNFIITSRAWKASVDWSLASTYLIGRTVIVGQTLGVPQIYLCLKKHFAQADNAPGTPGGEEYWEKIELSNLEYYNVYTMVFNEQKNSFTHRYSFFPKIFHTLNNRYFSPSPYTGESNEIYRHRDKDAGEIVFYGRENEGFTEYVINYMPRIVKKFIAHAQTALLKPKRVEFETQFISENGIDDRKTYLDRADFMMRENQAFSPIKNNLNAQGRNDTPTAPMTGLWLRIRTFFAANEKQKINDTTAVIRSGQRNVENP
jgi:hypothetical protein